MNCEQFLETAWNDHADNPDAVAHRLAESLHLIATPTDVAAFARIVTHVYGEHLQRWQAGDELLETLRHVTAVDESEAPAGAIVRGQAMLRHCGGSAEALRDLPVADRASVLAMAASTFVGQQRWCANVLQELERTTVP